jgi:hypothetical protein
MQYKINDIVLAAPGWSKAIFIITKLQPENPKNQYVGMNLLTGKSYRLSEDGLADKRIGVADLVPQGDGEIGVTVVSDQVFQLGQQRAQREIRAKLFGGSVNPRWEILAKLKAGEGMTIILNGREQMVTFKNVIAQGSRYVFVATNTNGVAHKYPLEVIKANVPKRSEDTIMDEISGVYNGFSPENLCCDGEASHAQITRTRRMLGAKLAELQRELGRNVSEDEAMDWYMKKHEIKVSK